MNEDMNATEVAVKEAKENQILKILLIIEELKKEDEQDSKKILRQLEDKLKALLNN